MSFFSGSHIEPKFRGFSLEDCGRMVGGKWADSYLSFGKAHFFGLFLPHFMNTYSSNFFSKLWALEPHLHVIVDAQYSKIGLVGYV